MPISECWEVEVRVDGEPVLTIGSSHLSGVNDIDSYADTIRHCSESLAGFVGQEQPAKVEACEWITAKNSDLHLTSCGYLFRVFAEGAPCPECGKAIKVKGE